MHITHNQHLNYYETIEQAIETKTYDTQDWPDNEELERSKQTGEVWQIQWYPEAPVGFCIVCASTFERALEEACKNEI
jgi:hypothetical protein